MPSRFSILLIVAFWLASTTWLALREIVPLFRTGEPPAFFTDITDEVRGTTITWKIFRKGQNIGWGESQVEPRPDRSFTLSSTLRFNVNEFKILVADVTKIAGRYRVDKDGNLKSLATEVRITLAGRPLRGEIEGTVVGGQLVPKVKIDGVETDLGPLKPQPVNVGAHGNVLNTMHLINKIPGLYQGRSWRVPLIDPLGALLPGQKSTISVLIALVHEDTLTWQDHEVPCYRIDYAEPGKQPLAHTWVRRGDGLVLEQQASQNDMDLTLVREASK